MGNGLKLKKLNERMVKNKQIELTEGKLQWRSCLQDVGEICGKFKKGERGRSMGSGMEK